jgi:hypothetical protein
MEKRSRLQVGVDVPWVTSWSAEPVLGVRPCATVDGRLAVVQAEKAGYGRPNYSLNHLNRQRLSVRRMLCPMCGEPTAEDDRWTLTAKLAKAGDLRDRGLDGLLPPAVRDGDPVLNCGSISPLHLACAHSSQGGCPHLQGLEDLELLRFPRAWAVIPLFIEARPPNVAASVLARPTPGVPVVSFLQLCGLPAARPQSAPVRPQPPV